MSRSSAVFKFAIGGAAARQHPPHSLGSSYNGSWDLRNRAQINKTRTNPIPHRNFNPRFPSSSGRRLWTVHAARQLGSAPSVNVPVLKPLSSSSSSPYYYYYCRRHKLRTSTAVCWRTFSPTPHQNFISVSTKSRQIMLVCDNFTCHSAHTHTHTHTHTHSHSLPPSNATVIYCTLNLTCLMFSSS
jgi:hypothetical protein